MKPQIVMTTDKNPNLDTVSDDDIKDVANKLGVNLDDTDIETEEKESDSSKKTDTETTEKNIDGNSEKPSEKDEVDYKKKYSESTKEFQEKYKPLEDSIKKLEQLSGKGLDDILKDYTKSSEQQIESKEKAEKGSSANDEVNQKLSSVEKKLSSLEEKVLEQDKRNQISAKEKVQSFQGKYGISEEDYSRNYQPLLSGIKEMKKANGDPYTLQEALEISYLVFNKDTVDKVVEKKLQIRQREQDLSFSPQGSKQFSSTEKPKYTSEQQEAAKRMGIDLEKSDEKKSS